MIIQGKMKKKIILILLIIIALILLTATILYFRNNPEKPWLAFYIACCAGVLVVNLIATVFLVNKNYKDKNKR